MEAPGLPNDSFWIPKNTMSVPKVIAMSENAIKTNLQKPTFFRTFHSRTITLEQPTTSKPSKADELAQHSHHHTALFPRVGAGGRGRSP